ncbi:MAG TPA: type II secretion system protein [Sedimentisphaerales bacterium]|nr:type II secretion system protein [Sedimentisphaerales bacterium]
MCKQKRGFTLIELLVVIAIIALLMSILIPAISKAKQQAKTVVCQSNLHQWGLVMKMYTDDNKGLFMADLGYERYAALGRPELKEYWLDDGLLLCPAAKKPYEEGAQNPFGAWRGKEDKDPLGNLPCSYGLNSWMLSKPCASNTDLEGGARLWKTPNTRQAAYAPMIFDCYGYENATPQHKDVPPLWDGQYDMGSSDDEMRYVCLNRHNEHVNIIFCDYAIRKVGLKELWELKWHRNWNPNHDPPPAEFYDPEHWMFHMKDYAAP